MEEDTTVTVESSEVPASEDDTNIPESSVESSFSDENENSSSNSTSGGYPISSDVVYDYTEYFQSIISNQEIELQTLTEEKTILLEQLEGFSLIAQYQNYFFCIAIGVIVVTLLWNVLNKWFFRGI